MINISKIFDLNSTLIDMKTYKKIRVYSADLCRFFETNFPETKFLTGSLRVPKKIMQSENKFLASYLQGLFDADGGIFDRFVYLDLVDKQVLQTVQLLLLRFGILSGLRDSSISPNGFKNSKQSYRLDITDFDSLKLYEKKIGFTQNSRKDVLLKNIIQKQNRKNRNSMLFSPITYSDLRNFVKKYKISRKIFDSQIIYKRTGVKRMNYTTLKKHFIKPILNNKNEINKEAIQIVKELNNFCFTQNLKFFEIKKIKIQKNKEKLFDLSIPKTENYVANGLVVHNSIAAGCKVPKEKIMEFLEKLDLMLGEQLGPQE